MFFFFRSEQLFVMFQCIMVVFSNACVQVRGAFSLKDVWFDRVFFLISLHSLSNHSSFFCMPATFNALRNILFKSLGSVFTPSLLAFV